MKDWKDCPTCWGTGFYKGYGMPCAQKNEPGFTVETWVAKAREAGGIDKGAVGHCRAFLEACPDGKIELEFEGEIYYEDKDTVRKILDTLAGAS